MTRPHGVRAQSFGSIAESYDRFRPGPPGEALDWVLQDNCQSALDLGAGTGAMTRVLLRRVPAVTAVEPDPRMRQVLTERVPGATVLAGRAEEIPLPDASVDAVLVSSAWHWMDPERAPYEVARVLRPGGRFGLLWNGRDRQVRWVADLEEIVRAATVTDEEKETPESTHRDGVDDAAPQDRRPRAERVRMPDDAPFRDTATHIERWSRPITPGDVVGLIGTYSRIIVLPEAQRQALLERVADFTRTDPALAGRDTVDLPMTCRCWRATRA